MNKLNKLLVGTLLAIFAVISTTVSFTSVMVHAAPVTVDLGTAEPFAILAGTPGITDAGNASVIEGNVGLSPASGTGIGLLCSQVNGVIFSVDAAGPLPCRVTNGPLLVTAKNNLTAAYNDAAGRTPVTTVPTELGGTTKIAGVYDSTSTTFDITAGAGALVLDGQNDPSSVFIFQVPFSGTGLTVGPGSTVSLVNGAQACNVFWRVDSASIDTTASFKGNILALNSITVANGATIEGRLLARNGSVTLINNTITVPTCATPSGTGNTSGTTPGFPNSGAASQFSNVWFALPMALIGLITLAIFVARKKQLI